VAFGFVLFYWILAPALHFSNVWYGKFMPISTRTAYDNTGLEYDVTKILDENNRFNEAAYKAYSPLFLSTVFAIAYGTSFASITATLMHAFLYFRKQIWNQARRSLKEQPDIHARLMARYPEVPEWWYMIIFITMFVFGAVAIEVYHTGMPMWALVLSLVIGVWRRYSYLPLGLTLFLCLLQRSSTSFP
jgi:OPT family oligopeptide transporter